MPIYSELAYSLQWSTRPIIDLAPHNLSYLFLIIFPLLLIHAKHTVILAVSQTYQTYLCTVCFLSLIILLDVLILYLKTPQ